MTKVEIPEFLKYKYCHQTDGWSDKKIELPYNKAFGRTVAIMRANPPHVNHTAMLRELCDKSLEVKVNLGSINKFNNKNPFKIEEREDMIRLALGKYTNFQVVRLPDFDNDEKWFAELRRLNGDFTEILSNNPNDLKIYTANQYEKGHEGQQEYRLFDIIRPVDVITPEKMLYVKSVIENGARFLKFKKPVYVSGTLVRAGMVKNWNWEDFVDEPVAKYLKDNGLIKRLEKMCPELKNITIEKIDDGR